MKEYMVTTFIGGANIRTYVYAQDNATDKELEKLALGVLDGLVNITISGKEKAISMKLDIKKKILKKDVIVHRKGESVGSTDYIKSW